MVNVQTGDMAGARQHGVRNQGNALRQDFALFIECKMLLRYGYWDNNLPTSLTKKSYDPNYVEEIAQSTDNNPTNC